MSKIYFFTNIAPHYRKSLWKQLLENTKCECHFFYGENKASGIPTIDFNQDEFSAYKKLLHPIKNLWFKSKVLVWQHGIMKECFSDNFHTAVFLGEMYCFSTWLAAIICRIRGIKVAFWGHGLYGNEGKLKLFIRKLFYRLADNLLLYERRSKQLMIEVGFKPENLYVVFNSLDYDTHKDLRSKFLHLTKETVLHSFSNPNLLTFIFIGRLTIQKKLQLLIESVKRLNDLHLTTNLLIIGDGPAMEELKHEGENGLKKDWLHFTGACYDEEEIGRYLFVSDLCVSPGNVGLTAIHSLSLGTPVCTHSNMKDQMPEAEAITDGYNGILFEENNVQDLTLKIETWLKTNTDRVKIREQCYEIIDKYYNPTYQMSVINRLINNQPPEI